MSIEDVKQWCDSELDLRIDVDVCGKKEDTLRSGWIKFNDLSTYPMQYSTDIKNAREVQTRATEKDALKYLKHLSAVIGDTSYEKVEEYDLIQLVEVVRLLQATPRQISEAAYLTLKG